MQNELVTFKGMGDGVRINIDEHAQVYEVIAELEKKIIASKAFFGDGNCRICFGRRRFTPGEKQRFETITKSLLPLARVSFESDEKSSAASNDWIVEYKEKHGAHPADTVIEHKPEEKPVTKEEFFSVFRSNRARLYQGIVHEGMTIRSDGHLILLGTAENGAELIAVGNILVIGGLYGTAHAGCNGHNGSYILAMDMKPEQLKIASAQEKYSYEDEPVEDAPEPEQIKKSLFGKRKKKPEEEKPEPDKAPKENSAVALLKNNKIELDNFTIQTFTNLKNMI
ncbi:MAG: septum site-determining protein MinC [Oscillospiraceae bacterium]|nr:septum site-determining protein MinC [Oscillospiraceae bacterium]